MNRLFKYHAIFTQFLQRPSRIPILAIDARLCLFHPRADEARAPPEQRTGLSACRQSAGGFDHEFTRSIRRTNPPSRGGRSSDGHARTFFLRTSLSTERKIHSSAGFGSTRKPRSLSMTSFSFFVNRSLCNRCCFQEGTTTSMWNLLGWRRSSYSCHRYAPFSQKDLTSFAHQAHAFASAGWMNIELCSNRYRAILGCRPSAWGNVLGEDRHPCRLESEVLGKVDREALGPHDKDLQQKGNPGSAKKCGNDSKAMRCRPPNGSAKSSCSLRNRGRRCVHTPSRPVRHRALTCYPEFRSLD